MLGKMSPGQRALLAARGVRGRGRAWMNGTAVPTKPEELQEFLNDPTKVKAMLGNQPGENLFKFINAYAQQAQGPETDLNKLVAEETTRQLAAMLREQGASGADTTFSKVQAAMRAQGVDPQRRGASMLAGGKGAAYNKLAAGARLDNEFTDLGDLARVEWRKQTDPKLEERARHIRNAYSSINPSDGGFLIPEVLRSQLLQLALERAVVRPRATVIPMDSLTVPIPAVDVTSNVSSVLGGMVAYWAEEGSSFTESSAKFNQVKLVANKLTGYSAVPNELYQDAILALQAFIETNWPMALAWFEDIAFFSGNGVGQPLGFLNSGNLALISATAESGQPSTTLVWENLVNMYSRMLPASLGSAVWIASPNVLPQLFTMALSVGTGGAPIFISNGSGPAPMSILGRPLIISEKASTLGAVGDIAFVDLAYYLIGDRQSMTLDTSMHYLFGADKTAVRITQRVDGRPWIKSAITPQNNSSSLSPFVTLAAR